MNLLQNANVACEPIPTPRLGLVCITISDRVRFRTITRARFLSFDAEKRVETLRQLYADNLRSLHNALTFCHERQIKLYRVTAALFPLNNESEGVAILDEMTPQLAEIGPRAESLGIRVVVHPDQYIVLSSDSPAIIETSVMLFERHGRIMDMLGLPRSPWATMILHGGKSDRADRLAETIRGLSNGARLRLALENDEYAYGAAEILAVCQRAQIPMVFDVHHHAVHDKLTSYEDDSVFHFVEAARATWPDPAWQLVHLSNGRDSFADARHSDLITTFPSAFQSVPYVEVEAKGKEAAIDGLLSEWRKSPNSS